MLVQVVDAHEARRRGQISSPSLGTTLHPQDCEGFEICHCPSEIIYKVSDIGGDSLNVRLYDTKVM